MGDNRLGGKTAGSCVGSWAGQSAGKELSGAGPDLCTLRKVAMTCYNVVGGGRRRIVILE